MSLALAPDGRTLYVGGSVAIRAYRVAEAVLRSASGTGGCVTVVPNRGCAHFKPARLFGFQSLAISPDGRWLYAAGDGAFAFRILP